MASLPLLVLPALLLPAVLAPPAADDLAFTPIDADRYLEHVTWLADDARGGRETGTPGLQATAEYVAAAFEEAGLEPAGDEGTYFQHFTVDGRKELGDLNRLLAGPLALELGTDWIPFYTADTGSAEGPLVFCGYGIRDEEAGYDDFAGVDVEDAIVVVLRKGPRASQEGSRYLDPQHRRHMTFVSKINAAFRAGAAGVLVVNDPANHEGEEDTLLAYRSIGRAGPGASLPAGHLTARAGRRVLELAGHDLDALQRGIDETLEPASFTMGVRARITIDAVRPEIDTVNVIGMLPGSDASLGDEHVVVGAHMDHVGVGGRGSLAGESGQGEIHNGADDNASGTAAVIEIARRLAERGPRRRAVLFQTYSGEEWGLLGSRHYVEHPVLPIDDCVTMFNMDMIGRGTGGACEVSGVGTSPGFEELVVATHRQLGLDLDLSFGAGVTGNSDHAPFFAADVPILSMFTGLHDDYHRPSDDVELIEEDAAAGIASLVGALAARIADAPTRPAFTEPPSSEGRGPRPAAADEEPGEETPDDPHGDGDGDQVVAYGVSFGSQPDMSYQKGDGVRLSGVREGSTAQRAGLRKGDRIVALGTVEEDGGYELREIGNLEDYAVLLFAHEPGDRIALRVVRDGETFEVQATLEGRGEN